MTRWWMSVGAYARPHARALAALLVLLAATALFEVLKPWPLKLILDHVIGEAPLTGAAARVAHLPGAGSRAGLLVWLTSATVLLFLCAWGSRLAQAYVQAGVGSRMTYSLAADLLTHLQRLSLRFHGRQQAGDLVQRLTVDVTCISHLILGVCLPLATSAITLALMAGVMWRLDPILAAVAMTAAPVIGGVILTLTPAVMRLMETYVAVDGSRLALAEQTLSALPTVHAFGRERDESARYAAFTDRIRMAYLRTVVAQASMTTAAGVVTTVGTLVVIGLGARHVMSGTLTIGGLVVFLSYLAALYGPMEALALLSSAFASASASARRVLQMLAEDDRVPEAPGAIAMRRGRGHLVFDRVSFEYEPDRPVLEDITLELRPGEVVALAGPTGAGKSTLVSLVSRLFDPSAGRVVIDGLDLRRATLSSVRAQSALVLQEAFILPLTVAGNIAYARPDAARAEIVEAARHANAHDFISALPQGYDTVLGPRGMTLSGGERQRIGIARALLKDAPILVLDEPTASLDADNEMLVMDAIERLMAGRSVLLIAHRLSTLRRADRIAVLDRGRLVELGTHADLLRAGGLYRRLWDASDA